MTVASIALARLVAEARISRLSLVGLAKNVGKTTATNYLLQALLDERLYEASELALTSLGLDGEAVDALTGLPKPRYIPQAGLLVATTGELLRQAEGEGARFERLQQLPGRTALGPVFLARVQQPGKVVIAGPTLLRDLRATLDLCSASGVKLGIVDGAINRLGAAAPAITDACILCAGTSVGATPELAARRSAHVFKRLVTPPSIHADAYMNTKPQTQARLLRFAPNPSISYRGLAEPQDEARWILEQMQHSEEDEVVYFLHGALTGELTDALLALLTRQAPVRQSELVVEDATKIFCHPVTLTRLAARGLDVRVARGVHVLAITMNPCTPEYSCTPQHFLDALSGELPEDCPPVIDVVSGIIHSATV